MTVQAMFRVHLYSERSPLVYVKSRLNWVSCVLSGDPASKARVLTSSQRHRAALVDATAALPGCPGPTPSSPAAVTGSASHVCLSLCPKDSPLATQPAQPSAGAQDLLGFSRGAGLHQGGVRWWAQPGVRTPSWDVLARAPYGCLVGCLAGLKPLPPVTAPPPLQAPLLAFLAPCHTSPTISLVLPSMNF